MPVIDDYNKAAEAYKSAPKKERDKITKDIVAMEKEAAREGKTFVGGGAKGFELKATGPSKIEAQTAYARRFDNEKRTGHDQKTDRERVAARLWGKDARVPA